MRYAQLKASFYCGIDLHARTMFLHILNALSIIGRHTKEDGSEERASSHATQKQQLPRLVVVNLQANQLTDDDADDATAQEAAEKANEDSTTDSFLTPLVFRLLE
jgi:hypothetical protein